MKKRTVLILALALGFGLTAGVAEAAKPVISLSGTDWTLSGKMGVNVAKVGKAKVEDDVHLLIGPNETESLAENEFKFTDGYGLSFTGTVALVKNTYVLTPESDELEQYIEDLLVALATQEQIQAVITSVDLGTVKISVKPKAAKTGIGVMWTANIKASFAGTLDGEPVETKVTIVMKHRGEIEIPIPGSSWLLDTTVKVVIKALAKIADEGTMNLFLGPNDDEGVLAGEYKAEGDEGELFTGAFTIDSKGKLDFGLVENQVETFLAFTILAQADPQFVTDATVDILSDKTKITAKVSPGVSMLFSLKIQFTVQLETTMGPMETKGSLSVKGTGVPQ